MQIMLLYSQVDVIEDGMYWYFRMYIVHTIHSLHTRKKISNLVSYLHLRNLLSKYNIVLYVLSLFFL